jgi:cell wall-associated NlpC family hydrolase
VTGPLYQGGTPSEATPVPRNIITRPRVPSRLAAAMRNPTFEDTTFLGEADNAGVDNPYGKGLSAYEPNTVWFTDVYGKIKSDTDAKNAEEEAAANTMATVDLTPGNSNPVEGVPFADIFNSAGQKYGVPPALLAAVAKAESGFNTQATSPAGAQGLMQFMPGTAAGMNVNPWDPTSAIYGAARYLQSGIQQFGTVEKAVAAYNAGPGAVQKYGGIPPFTETQNYVARVMGYFQSFGGGDLGATDLGPSGGGFIQADGQVNRFVSAAMGLAAKQTPYAWGGSSSSGVDCSGLVAYAAQAAGISWQRFRAQDYGQMGTAVSLQAARPGDIVYYDQPGDTDHVGIYIGNGMMVQAPNTGDHVRVTGVGRFTSIRRVFNDNAFSAGATTSGGSEALYNGQAYAPSNSEYTNIMGRNMLETVSDALSGAIRGPIPQSARQQQRATRFFQ